MWILSEISHVRPYVSWMTSLVELRLMNITNDYTKILLCYRMDKIGTRKSNMKLPMKREYLECY
jgi:hypothetical protein